MSSQSNQLTKLLPKLSNSGFPFQMAVAASLQSIRGATIEEEVAWSDNNDSHNFIDIVVSIEQLRLCIECKTLRDTNLVFHLPIDPNSGQTHTLYAATFRRESDSTQYAAVYYGNISANPPTHAAKYCNKIGTDKNKDKTEERLLESDIRPLIHGAEAYARDRCREQATARTIACIPVFITTAKLYVAEYALSDVSLQSGIFQAQEQHLKEVPYIRFTKQFTAHGHFKTRLRTAVVTQADHIKELAQRLADFGDGPNVDHWPVLWNPAINRR